MTFVVKEIWRYPVKSMQGERLDASAITATGVPYDRGWSVRDEKTQTIRGAKHLAKLLLCSARYPEGASARAVSHVEITLPSEYQDRLASTPMRHDLPCSARPRPRSGRYPYDRSGIPQLLQHLR